MIKEICLTGCLEMNKGMHWRVEMIKLFKIKALNRKNHCLIHISKISIRLFVRLTRKVNKFIKRNNNYLMVKRKLKMKMKILLMSIVFSMVYSTVIILINTNIIQTIVKLKRCNCQLQSLMKFTSTIKYLPFSRMIYESINLNPLKIMILR